MGFEDEIRNLRRRVADQGDAYARDITQASAVRLRAAKRVQELLGRAVALLDETPEVTACWAAKSAGDRPPPPSTNGRSDRPRLGFGWYVLPGANWASLGLVGTARTSDDGAPVADSGSPGYRRSVAALSAQDQYQNASSVRRRISVAGVRDGSYTPRDERVGY